jgi:hypothetical protein
MQATRLLDWLDEQHPANANQFIASWSAEAWWCYVTSRCQI